MEPPASYIDAADLVVVGAGLFGLTVAERAANVLGSRVLILEGRDHVGGNAYSYLDEATGIEVHKYGTHIFHTSSARVWSYVSRFTSLNSYRHTVWTRHGDRVYPMPINLATISALVGRYLTPSEAQAFLAEERGAAGLEPPRNFEEAALASVGPRLYEAFIRGYTRKQWQTEASQLPAAVFARIGTRLTMDSNYFTDRWQGLPVDGYTTWMERMVDHDNIHVCLQTDFFDLRAEIPPGKPVVYTGALDRFFDYREGLLGWRTLDFELDHVPVADYQGTAVMNYADEDVPFTRVHEFRHLHPERECASDATVIMREFSRWAGKDDEPYYPVNAPSDRAILSKYRDLARLEPHVLFGGRLGTYKYLDMHAAIASALTMFESKIKPALKRSSGGGAPK